MLRFTKTLALSFRQRESLFSIDFWKGLGYAAAFHVALLAIFRIAHSPNFDILPPLLPIDVEIDLGLPETSAELPTTQMMLSPFATLDFPTSHFAAPPPFSHKMKNPGPDFSAIEKLPYEPIAGFVEEVETLPKMTGEVNVTEENDD